MKAKRVSEMAGWLGALLIAGFALVAGHAKAGIEPQPFRFETELLSLSLTGTGLAPIFNPQTGGFDLRNVTIDVRETPGRRHLGEIRADPLPGGEFHVDSFFDVFVDVGLSDPQSRNPLASFVDVFIHLRNLSSYPPDPVMPAMGLFPRSFTGPGALDLGGLHVVFDAFDLGFDFPPDPIHPPDPVHPPDPIKGTAALNVAGEVNPPFGPFRLSGPTTVLVTQIPAPATLGLLALGMLGLGFARRR